MTRPVVVRIGSTPTRPFRRRAPSLLVMLVVRNHYDRKIIGMFMPPCLTNSSWSTKTLDPSGVMG